MPLKTLPQDQSKIDSLSSLLQNDRDKGRVLRLLSEEYLKFSIDRAEYYGKEALNRAKQFGPRREFAYSLNNLGIINRKQRKYELARDYFQQSLSIWKALPDSNMIANVSNNIGNTFRNQGEYDAALDYLQQALDCFDALNNEAGMSMCLNNIGLLYKKKLNYPEALSYYLKSLSIAEKLNNKKEIARTTNNIANIHKRLKDYEKALKYALVSLSIEKEQNNPSGTAQSYNNIGILYGLMKIPDKSLEYFQNALQLNEEIGDKPEISKCLHNLGEIYVQYSDWEKAQNHFFQSLELDKELKNSEGLAYNLNSISKVYLNQKKYGQAIRVAKESLELARSLRLKEIQKEAYQNLSHCYTSLREHQKALYFYQQYTNLKDSLLNESIAAKTLEVQSKYEADKSKLELQLKNAELERQAADIRKKTLQGKVLAGGFTGLFLLSSLIFYFYWEKRKSNTVLTEKSNQIAQKNLQIEQALLEKEILLKEIHHRVKNNLEIISSLISLQTANVNDEVSLKNLSDWQNRIDAIAIIHKELYRNDDFSKIDFQTYIEKLTAQLSKIYDKGKSITTIIEAQNISLDINFAIPLGLITNELVSNAYKHAFERQQSGRIQVILRMVDSSQLELSVRDNGTGLPDGFDLEKSESLGLKLVNLLSRQINGRLYVSNGNGTVFNLTFSPDNLQFTDEKSRSFSRRG